MSGKRYFIVSYNFGNGKVPGSGQTTFVTDGCYQNRQIAIEQIASTLECENAEIVILNIIELPESDYNVWSAQKTN